MRLANRSRAPCPAVRAEYSIKYRRVSTFHVRVRERREEAALSPTP